MTLVAEQLLNGLQFGLMLFLIAAGLTLVFGIMDTMNLAHGSLYMAGAYVAARVHEASEAFALAVAVAVGVTVAIAAVVEFVVIRRLYRRDHLVQVLATFGIILIADDAVKAIWGVAPLLASTPAVLAGPLGAAFKPRRKRVKDDSIPAEEPEAETVYYIYVVDRSEHLRGVFSLRELLMTPPEKKVRDFMTENPISVHTEASEEEVTDIIAKYNLLALPVVDEEDELHGIIDQR